MQEKQQIKIFYARDYGGLPYINMPRNFVKVVMFFRDLGSLLGEMSSP
jgi:hypothetical protein